MNLFDSSAGGSRLFLQEESGHQHNREKKDLEILAVLANGKGW